jgi:hypothetical protein
MAVSCNSAYLTIAAGWNNRTSSATLWARRRGDPGLAVAFWYMEYDFTNKWSVLTASNGDDVYAGATEDGGTHNTANVLTGMVTDTWYYFFWSRNDATDALTIKYLASGGSSFAATQSTTGEFTPDAAGTLLDIGDAGSGVAIEMAAFKAWEGVVISDANALTERSTLGITTNTGSKWANYQFANGALTTDSSGNGRSLSVGAGSPSFVADPSDISSGTTPTGTDSSTVTDSVAGGFTASVVAAEN